MMTGPIRAVYLAFAHTFNFKGRATRAEFWWAALFLGVLGVIAGTVDAMMISAITLSADPSAIYGLGLWDFYTVYYGLVTAIPYLSLGVRRLHDAGYSGFWVLVSAVPLVGALALMVLCCLPSRNSPTAPAPTAKLAQKPTSVDVHKRAMQGYATLFETQKPVTQEMQAARKAEIGDYYRNKVLKSAPAA